MGRASGGVIPGAVGTKKTRLWVGSRQFLKRRKRLPKGGI